MDRKLSRRDGANIRRTAKEIALLPSPLNELESFKRQSIREFIALGSLFNNLFMQRYHRHFPPESPLWEFYTRYVMDWDNQLIQIKDETPARAVDDLIIYVH